MSYYFETYSGIQFNIEHPKEEDIFIDDFAESLCKQVRFNGHTKIPYTIAAHCCVLTDWVQKQSWSTQENALLMLLHHGVDVYISDITPAVRDFVTEIGPVKTKIETAIAQRFRFSLPWPEWLYDIHSLITPYELKALGGKQNFNIKEKIDITIPNWDWQKSKREFLKRFVELCPNYQDFCYDSSLFQEINS